jgi:hypothetical protein
VAALKRHGLLPRLLETVAAATSLEVLFRQLEVAKRAFGLAFLDKHCKTIWKDPKVRLSMNKINKNPTGMELNYYRSTGQGWGSGSGFNRVSGSGSGIRIKEG